MSTVEDRATAATPALSSEKPMVVIDLGKKSKKQVKRLRKGTGRLMDRVADTVDQLRADGEVKADAQIVVVVVKQDDDRKGMFW